MFKKLSVLLLMLMVTTAVQSRITVGNQDIKSLIEPGQAAVYEDLDGSNIAFRFENNNLSIGELDSSMLGTTRGWLHDLEQDELSMTSGDKIRMKSGRSIEYGGASVTGQEEIFLQAGESIQIKSSIFEAPEIFLLGAVCNFNALFIKKCKFVQIESTSEESLFKIIKFTLSENSQFPHMIQGSLNFKTNSVPETFLVVGATKVEVLFNDSAFED